MQELFAIIFASIEAGFGWPGNGRRNTFLLTLDIEPRRVLGLDTTLITLDGVRPAATDLQTSLGDIDQLIARGNSKLADDAQLDLSMKAAVHLGLACAMLLHWIHVGKDEENITAAQIQENIQSAVRLFTLRENRNAVLWSSFIADLTGIICQPVNIEAIGVQSATTMGAYLTESRELCETAANICLRLTISLRTGTAHLHSSGEFERQRGLLLYGLSLSEMLSSEILQAQMHGTLARLYIDVMDFSAASVELNHTYGHAIAGSDARAPPKSYKQIVDAIFVSYVETNNESGLSSFYDKLERTWPERLNTSEDGQSTLQWFRNQREIWLLKVRARQCIRENRFYEAQKLVAERFELPLPQDEAKASQELYNRSNLGMNYGHLELAREACEQLDAKPLDYFARVGRWERTPFDTWQAFEACVERTAFRNSIRFLDRLKASPEFLHLSSRPTDHALDDYKKLVQVARVYIFEGLWAEALALLKCSCSLVVKMRETIVSEQLQDNQYDNALAEKAFDWTVWVCLHFLAIHDGLKPKDLDEKAFSNDWGQEALLYAEWGKCRRIGDTLRKRRTKLNLARDSQISYDLTTEDHLWADLAAWLDPETLVIHLTLCDEGLGLICCDVDGVSHAQWLPGLPGFGRWDVQRETSIIYAAIEQIQNQRWDWEDESLAKNKEIRAAIEHLSVALISPISNLLKAKSRLRKRICFMPASQLARVPFSALELDGEPLITLFTVYQAPSLRVLRELFMTSKARAPDLEHVSIVVQASHDEGVELLETAVECVNVSDQMGAIARLENAFELSKEGFLACVSQCDILHLGTHGIMKYQKPLDSYILLQQRFSVADMHQIQSAAKLIFFNACLTGLGHSSLTDDIIGFQAQILQSGASAFAGLLWVGDASASLFFSHFFYEHLANSQDNNETLADVFTVAQRRLRTLKRDEARDIVRNLEQHWNQHRAAADLAPDILELGTDFFDLQEDRLEKSYAHLYFWAPYVFVGCPSKYSRIGI